MLKSARLERKTLTEIAQEELRQAIVGGTFQPEGQLPTEAELCEMLGVSRTVVREALRVLENDGLVARRHGVGTFVRNLPIIKNLNFNFGITEMIESAGLKPGTSDLSFRKDKLIRFHSIPCLHRVRIWIFLFLPLLLPESKRRNTKQKYYSD